MNAYLREVAGEEFTAKDFRTWAGTVLAALALREFEAFDSQTQAKKNVVRAIEPVAERLGNTPTVCRKCYVHPEIIDAYLDGSMLETLKQVAEQEMAETLGELPPEEAAVLALLQQRLAAQEIDGTDCAGAGAPLVLEDERGQVDPVEPAEPFQLGHGGKLGTRPRQR